MTMMKLLMLCTEVTAVSTKNRKKAINTLRSQNTEFMTLNAGGK
jgi:hypothetical protein